MAMALAELFVEINAKTGGFDKGIASSRSGLAGLSSTFGRTRDANGRFIGAVNASSALMAGRYLDATGRMREANGRFVGGMGGVAGSASRAARGFAGLQLGLGGLRRGFGAVSTAVGTFAGNVTSRLAAIAVPVIGDILGGTAIDMEKRIGGLAKATDLAGPALARMKAEVFDLSTTLKGVALNDLIDIATTGAKMGIAEGGLLKFTEGIAKASTAVDDMSALDLAETVGKVNTVFKLGEGGALQLASAFDKLADSGVSSFSGIANVVGRISGAASAAHITAQESAALAAALLDTGTMAELGATALTRLIASLNDAEAQGEFGKVLGVSAEEFATKVRASPIAAIQEFLAALNKMSAGDQMKALKGIGFEGVQGAGEIQKLAAQSQVLARNVGLANSEFKTLDQVNKSYNQTASQAGAAIVQQQNRFQIMADTIGTALLPAIGAAGGLFGGLATRIAASAGSGGAFATFAASVAGGLVNVGIAASAVGTGLGKFSSILAEMLGPETTAALTQFGSDFVHYMGEAVAQVGVVLRNLPAYFDVAALMIQEKVLNIGEIFASIPANLSLIADYIGGNWFALMHDGVDAVLGLFEGLGTNVRALGDALIKFLADPTQGFSVEWTPLLTGFKASAAQLPALIRPHLTSMQGEIDAKLAAIAQAEARRTEKAPPPIPAFRGFGANAFAAGGAGALGPTLLGKLGIGGVHSGVAAAAERAKLSPRQRAASRRAAAGPAKPNRTTAQARRALVLQRQARAALKSPRKPAATFLEEINKGIGQMVDVNKTLAVEIKKRPVATFQ